MRTRRGLSALRPIPAGGRPPPTSFWVIPLAATTQNASLSTKTPVVQRVRRQQHDLGVRT